ncbi:MAG: tripartite tricarboxylate transporter permease [Deltaproteobacteria bacterium]|nr:tripartite tricarboxylate transporter permease [Deltaproteobacteria bacterium]
MDLLNSFQHGLLVATQLQNLFFCFLGVLGGTFIGVLPGIGPLGAIALLLPSTFFMSPVAAMIMLAGIYYGAMYGGSTTSILLNIPGEAASVVTCIDGYQMGKKGRAGPALGICAFGSFIAGTIGVILLLSVAPPLARFALRFGPPEYFSLMLLGLTVLVYLANGPIIKALMMAALGLILGVIGTDLITGRPRFTFGLIELEDGLNIIPVVMGLFGVSEVLINIEIVIKRHVSKTKIKGLLPSLQDWKDSIKPIFRGSFLGFFLGTLPGGGALIASFASYAMEKKLSKHPEKFGTGAIEGVAGPESANNSASQGAFIPLLTLGIPNNAVMALMLGALIIHGVQPGPLLMKEEPDIFWGVIASMYIGNIMLLVLNLPLIGMWVQVLKIPYRILFPLILLFCFIGVYSVKNSILDLWFMIGFGVLGYLMKKFEYEMAPLVLALILGPMFENALRQSMILFDGNPIVFLTRPISAFFILFSAALLLSTLVPWIKERKHLLTEEV